MTLRAVRSDQLRILGMLRREPHEGGVARMVDVGDPVAGITIERRFVESMGLRVEGGRVAAGAFQRKLVVFPSGFVWLLNRVFAVPVLLQRPRVIRLRADEVVAVI